ncbi:MAG: aminoacyl-tRNA hydrolase [Sphingomonadales bacterium]|nr:aminoacyl-tRNA hydrolase [Sphingomonadales bacterium]
MLIFVGLGNPGGKYAANRHNIGFMAMDTIVRRHNFSAPKSRFNAEVSEGNLGGTKILILKPQTFMNRSGQAVGEAMRYFKSTPDDVIVFYDEADLAEGKVKIKKGGGAAGHNGIKDIKNHIGADFTRVRLGVGHPRDRHPDEKLHSHVLSDFSKMDQKWLEPLLDTLADEADSLVEDRALSDGVKFMTNVARKLKPNKHELNNSDKESGQK